MVKLLFILYISFFLFCILLYTYFIIFTISKTFKYEKCILVEKKSNCFSSKIKKKKSATQQDIYKLTQETKLWKVSLKSVCISRQCSFIGKKRGRELERTMGKGEARQGFPGPFRFRFPAFPRTFLERKSISFGSTHRTKHSRYSPREGRRGRKPGSSLLRSTQIIE